MTEWPRLAAQAEDLIFEFLGHVQFHRQKAGRVSRLFQKAVTRFSWRLLLFQRTDSLAFLRGTLRSLGPVPGGNSIASFANVATLLALLKHGRAFPEHVKDVRITCPYDRHHGHDLLTLLMQEPWLQMVQLPPSWDQLRHWVPQVTSRVQIRIGDYISTGFCESRLRVDWLVRCAAPGCAVQGCYSGCPHCATTVTIFLCCHLRNPNRFSATAACQDHLRQLHPHLFDTTGKIRMDGRCASCTNRKCVIC